MARLDERPVSCRGEVVGEGALTPGESSWVVGLAVGGNAEEKEAVKSK